MSAPLFCRCVRQGLCRFDKGWIDACETPQTFVRRETHRRNRVEMAEQWHYFKRIFWWGRLAEATVCRLVAIRQKVMDAVLSSWIIHIL